MGTKQEVGVNFVIPEGETHQGAEVTPEGEWPLFYGAEAAWILQSYYRLRELPQVRVNISSNLERDQVNIASSTRLRRLCKEQDLAAYFIVNCLTDKPDYIGANVRIVQNKEQVSSTQDFWVPVWPQPGLKVRDSEQPLPSNPKVVFLGRPRYGLNSVRGKKWSRVLGAEGFIYEEREAWRWNDYRDVDIAVGVRSFGPWRYPHKPPSKLVNAWLAGVPFIGGADSAYPQVGRPNEDFLRVTSPQELVEALEYLRCPKAWSRTRDAGQVAGNRYDRDALLAMWRRVIEDAIVPRFLGWVSAGMPRTRRIGTAARRLRVWKTRIGRRGGWF